MKRTLTSIAAAALVLGAMTPAAFAASTANNAAKVVGTKAVVVDGTTISNPYELTAVDSGNTTAYFGVHYFDQALTKAGFTSSWDGNTHTWAITAPNVDATKIQFDTTGSVGTGNTSITINGVVVKKINTFSHVDPADNTTQTTYFPVYYVNNLLTALGAGGSWDATAGLTVKSPAPAAFGIKSIQAVNGQEVDVTFTQPVNAGQTFSAANLGLTAVGSATAPGTLTYSVSADGKTVSIYTSNVLTQGGYYVVAENGVQDANLNPLAPYSTTIQVNDKTAPSISSVTAVTNQSTTRQFTISFSEPVQFDMVKVGSVVAGATTTDGGWDYTVTLPASATALTVGQSYTVTINGLRDLEGNYAPNPTTTTVAVIQDVTAPTYTLSAVSPSQFNVVFSKKMNTAVNVDSITVKDANGNVLPLAALPSFASDGKTLHVTLAASAIASGYSSATVSVEVKDLTDSVGNAVADSTNSLTLTKSTVSPTITAARLVPATTNEVQVTFNEAVSGLATSDFAITDSTGATYAISSVDPQDSNNNVVLHLTSGLSSTDTYTVALIVNKVYDASGNYNAAATQKFTYTAPASAQLHAAIDAHTTAADTTATDSNTNRKVTVKFDQTNVVHGIDPTTGNYYAGAADNAANYTWDGAPLPTGTVVTFNDNDAANGGNDSVTLDFTGVAAANLPSDLANGGSGVLTVSNVKTSGSTVQYTSSSVVVADKTAPTLSSAYLQGNSTAGYTLTAFASEGISATGLAVGDFTVDVNGVAITPDSVAVSASNPSQLTFTITTAKATVAANLTKVTIAANGSGTSTDLASNTFAATVTPIAVTNYASN